MSMINRFFFTVTQLLLFIDSTRQSHSKQGVTAFKAISKTIKNPFVQRVANTIKLPISKAIGNTVKKSVGILNRQKNTMKNIACGIGEQCRSTKHNIGNKPMKYLSEGGIKKFKHLSPWATRGAKQLVRVEAKKNIQTKSAIQGFGKKLRPMMAKKSVEQIRGKELGKMINMFSNGKPQIPFLAGAGLVRLTATNIVADATFEESNIFSTVGKVILGNAVDLQFMKKSPITNKNVHTYKQEQVGEGLGVKTEDLLRHKAQKKGKKKSKFLKKQKSQTQGLPNLRKEVPNDLDTEGGSGDLDKEGGSGDLDKKEGSGEKDKKGSDDKDKKEKSSDQVEKMMKRERYGSAPDRDGELFGRKSSSSSRKGTKGKKGKNGEDLPPGRDADGGLSEPTKDVLSVYKKYK